MKRKIKVIVAFLLGIVMLFGNVTTSYAWTSEQIRAFEAKWGSSWTDLYISGSMEFNNYVDWNRGYWDNPTNPPAGFNCLESSVDVVPRDDSRWAGSTGSTAVVAPTKPACDHSYDMTITKEPTCVESGIAEYVCTKCNDKYTKELEASGTHDYVVETTKEASCTGVGENTYICSMCGDVYTEEIPIIEHEYTSEVTVKAGCAEDGENTFTCTFCGDTYTESIPAKGHSEGDFEITVENGWFIEGEQIKKCVSCEEILVTETIPSQYPIWYLYVAIGFAVVLSGTIVGVLIKKRK